MTSSPKKRKQHQTKYKGKQFNGKASKQAHEDDDATSDAFWDEDAPISGESFLTVDNVALICAVFGFLLYVNTIWECGFCYDDRVAIESNPDVLDNKSMAPGTFLLEVFEHDFWGLPLTDIRSNKSYRPLTVLSLRMDAYMTRILGTPGAPWVFHLVNALLYSLTCWMVVKFILSSSSTVMAHSQEQRSNIAILLSGLWFVSHPVHVESVAGLVGRADILAAIFSILGTKYHNESKTMASVTSFMAACLCKETSVVIPTVLAVTDVLKMCSPGVKMHHSSFKKRSSGVSSSAPPALVAVSLGYIQFRSWLFGDALQTLTGGVPLTDNFLQHLAFGTKLRTAIYIQTKYLMLLILPTKLSCDYGLGVIDPITTWWTVEMLHSVLAILFIAVWIRYGMARLWNSGEIVPLLALGWTLAPLIPACHLVNIGTVMAERLLFLPSIGVAMFLSHILVSVNRQSYSRLAFLLVVCILLFSFKTAFRNPNWSDSKTLFKVDLETYPRSLKMLIANIHGNVDDDTASWYADRAQGILEEHSQVFDAAELEHVRAKILLKMADLKMNSSDASEALLYADNLLERHKETGDALNVQAYTKKARTLLMLGIKHNDPVKLREAVAAYKLATQAGKVVDDLYWFDINEGKGRAFYELWRTTRDKATLVDAVEAYRVVISLGDVYRDNDERWLDIQIATGKALFALGVTNGNHAIFNEALAVFRQAVQFGNVSNDARWADLHEELGKTLLKVGPAKRDKNLIKEAANAFQVAIEYGDMEANFYVFCMLGTALAMLNEDVKAYEHFQQCFHREKYGGKTDVGLREDRFGYRMNYAILMRKLCGVRDIDAAAMRQWGRPALQAINSMLEMSKEEGFSNMLPPDQVHTWIVVKNAIKEQLDLDHSEL